MMKKLLLASSLMVGGQAIAAPTLIVGDNLKVLAAKSADVSIFSDNIGLQAGEQKIVVKYDSPENPSSTNQSNGRITSRPYVLTFHATGDEVIELATKMAADAAEIRALAGDPPFTLQVKGKAVPFTRSPLLHTKAFGSVSTSWDSVVNEETPAAAQGDTGPLNAMQALYLQSTAQQRKAFLKWALDVE